MITLREEYSNDNDQNALKEILGLVGGNITYTIKSKSYYIWVDFENDYLDKENLNKCFMIQYFSPEHYTCAF